MVLVFTGAVQAQSVDSLFIKKLADENPELVKLYEIPKPGIRRFLVQIGK